MKIKIKIIEIFGVFPLILCSCKVDKRTNAEQYFDQINECRNNKDFHTQLLVFPNELKGEIVKYFYMEESDVFTGSYFYYVVLKYNDETYSSEIDRISNIKAEFAKYNIVKPILSYPELNAFLSISKDNRYEYVLYNSGSNEIAYISNQLFTWDRAQVLPEHSMPSFVIPPEYDDGDNTYNMYYHYVDKVGWEITD